jgi:flavin-dependent dehydrogenase
MKLDASVIIIGGGLAGLTSAIHLSRAGIEVLLIEKNEYPHHKVCGEYISNEVLPYLNWLGIHIEDLKPALINKFELSSTLGKKINVELPLGGFGISRYTLDHYLYQKAIESGCKIIHETVANIEFETDVFTISTTNNTYTTKLAMGAYGKRNALDYKLNRNFINKKSGWLAVKAHYKGDFNSDTVALHHFKGGYCGVSTVENQLLNVCYLVNYNSFKSYKNIAEHQQNVLYQNPFLKEILTNSQVQFDSPLSISQISFQAKERVKNHVLMIGDTAGLIHPLCGNGMSMAIHSSKICSELLIAYLEGEISSREELEHAYEKQWTANFNSRLKTGKILSSLLSYERLADFLMNNLAKFPALLPKIIAKTHGKPIEII